jgi:hypothetical protein
VVNAAEGGSVHEHAYTMAETGYPA